MLSVVPQVQLPLNFQNNLLTKLSALIVSMLKFIKKGFLIKNNLFSQFKKIKKNWGRLWMVLITLHVAVLLLDVFLLNKRVLIQHN